MRCFFTPSIPEPGGTGRLDAEESRHAHRVLRIRSGETVELVDGAGMRASAQLTDCLGGPRRPQLEYRVIRREMPPEAEPRVRLCVAPPRSKAMALVVQQATELGVARICPILCEFGVAKPLKQSSLEHWRKEAVSALKQSGNPRLPALDPPVEFGACLRDCAGMPSILGQWRSDAPAQPRLSGLRELAVWVGPEGGFSEAEQEGLKNAGAEAVQIGRHILRVETAVVALLGWVLGSAA